LLNKHKRYELTRAVTITIIYKTL